MGHRSDSIFFTDSVHRLGHSLTSQFAEHLEFSLVKTRVTATDYDYYKALSLAIKDRLVRDWLRTQQTYRENDARRIYYLSLEFLMGRLLANILINMEYYEKCRDLLKEDGLILEDLLEHEYDMGLGNGGLGRLAACYLDSMATLGLPAFGYGIRYEYGIFRQEIRDGYQVEQPDPWLAFGNPWETVRPELTYPIRFQGRVETDREGGRQRFHWTDTDNVLALAYDIPVPGYRSNVVNNLRLWEARSTNEFSLQDFNRGDYLAAVEHKNLSENISKVLYPSDNSAEGKLLRLQQEYFFVSASLQDIIRNYLINRDSFESFSQKVFLQLNDTHPAVAIPELMRLLIDEHQVSWQEAWAITRQTFGYTNHTVAPEALEEWPVRMLQFLLPRHLQIIYEINHRFLEGVRREFTTDEGVISELSIIREGPEKSVRMANLAVVGSRSVNGVAKLHTEILRREIFPRFDHVFPGKIVNVTNGITPRRWLKVANPLLAQLITEQIGEGWVTDLERLGELERLADDQDFLRAWSSVKHSQKLLLKRFVEREQEISIDISSLFDSQVKRFHQYKRQLLNLLHVVTLYNRIKEDPDGDHLPRTLIFSGKAAPAYQDAKLVIKLVHSLAQTINNDPEVAPFLKVVFIENYSVSLAEKIIPATELSEQISTAGFEASGTGNMKFALNGALTIGTMDGANIEICEEVGKENLFIFGMTADQVKELKAEGYEPRRYYEEDPRLRQALDMIRDDYFNRSEPGIFSPLVEELLADDFYCLLADYSSYLEVQDQAAEAYRDQNSWQRKSVRTVARIGRFSSDRSILDYNERIWHAEPVPVPTERLGPI